MAHAPQPVRRKKMKMSCLFAPFTKRLRLVPVAFLCMTLFSQAQTERQLIRSGNKLYKAKKYSEAEIAYRKSLAKNKESVAGQYDLGNAYYKQQKFEEAQSQYSRLLNDKNVSKADKSKAYHNLGNAYLESKKFPESIEAYKNSLRLNPKDNDTRYNLAYAQSLLQQQQQQQQQDGKDKKQDKQKQDQQKQQQQKKDDKQQKEAARRENISREDAEKMLQALNNDEKNTQKKLVKKEGTRIQIAKQW